jgi:hypothetical protein
VGWRPHRGSGATRSGPGCGLRRTSEAGSSPSARLTFALWALTMAQTPGSTYDPSLLYDSGWMPSWSQEAQPHRKSPSSR